MVGVASLVRPPVLVVFFASISPVYKEVSLGIGGIVNEANTETMNYAADLVAFPATSQFAALSPTASTSDNLRSSRPTNSVSPTSLVAAFAPSAPATSSAARLLAFSQAVSYLRGRVVHAEEHGIEEVRVDVALAWADDRDTECRQHRRRRP